MPYALAHGIPDNNASRKKREHRATARRPPPFQPPHRLIDYSSLLATVLTADTRSPTRTECRIHRFGHSGCRYEQPCHHTRALRDGLGVLPLALRTALQKELTEYDDWVDWLSGSFVERGSERLLVAIQPPRYLIRGLELLACLIEMRTTGQSFYFRVFRRRQAFFRLTFLSFQFIRQDDLSSKTSIRRRTNRAERA
jgi:hypothetical protein